MDCSPPGFSVHEISQARILNGLPFPSLRDLPNPGIKPMSPALAGEFFTIEPPKKHLLKLEPLITLFFDQGLQADGTAKDCLYY